MKTAMSLVILLLLSVQIQAATVFSQSPVNNGTTRVSKLWVDPGPDGNNLDGDGICYEDIVLSQVTSIHHMEWWGKMDPGYGNAPNLGFQIEFWKQDPGTSAYQPFGVFREQGALPEYMFTTTGFTIASDASGTNHYSLDLLSPITLSANSASNPRWFVSVIGLTDVAYLSWYWAQGVDNANKSYQFVRAGSPHGGDLYTELAEGRAVLLADLTPPAVPEPSALVVLMMGVSALAFKRKRQ